MDTHEIEEKMKNLKEWNEERARVKPFIDRAVECHNRARAEVRLKEYKKASSSYKEAITNYKNAVSQNPRYYLHDLLERIDDVVEEYINNVFNLAVSGGKLEDETGIDEFVRFIDNLNRDEKRYIDPYNVAQAYLRIADFYSGRKNTDKAYGFYNKVIDVDCGRPFINRDVYFKMGKILFDKKRFKEALVNFVSVLSFDRGNTEVIRCLERCLERLGISEHKAKFLKATPNEAKKLIMEVL